MRRFTYIVLFVFTLIATPVPAETSVSADGCHAVSAITPYSGTFSYQAAEPVNIAFDGFLLVADSGSLKYSLEIQASKLPHKGGYPMRSNMANVSAHCDGIRLLPNGEHFSDSKPALISLSYDPDRIPRGYKPKDIYTFYCDDATTWHRLERVSIDTFAHTITSYTTHFTDFANAVIKIPDMPESKAFVPTAMTDLPDADPMHGIPMIEVPTPNNKGTAELTYPIELPKGRRGMQPNVDLHYSSAGGNGILGVGWNLITPAITIDTRWGAPRYSAVYETEQYLVNGAPVVRRDADGTALPLPYQDTVYLRRAGDVVRFYARDTKNADRIIRHGTDPTNYWWAVTDRNGITTFYGCSFNHTNPLPGSVDENSVVRTQDSCIAYWAATASVDVYGNYILYNNNNLNNTIYVHEILYTGNINQQTPPLYRVHLAYQNRDDVRSNGRLGVLQTENYLLCHLLVQYLHPDHPVPEYADNLAAYYFRYTEPQERTLYKSLLKEVVLLDSVHYLMLDGVCDLDEIIDGDITRNELWDLALIEAEHNHDLQLYNLLQQPYGASIPASTTTFSYADAPTAANLFSSTSSTIQNSGGVNLSKNHSTSWSIGGTVTVGAGANVALTTLSGGGNYDYSRSTGNVTSILLDLDGDGLTDIVSEANGIVSYKRQYLDNNVYKFAGAVTIPGLTRLSHEVTDTHTWGLQLSLGANLSYSNPISTTYTDTYFSDINADGLPDMIDGDVIRVNHLVNGLPTFGIFTGDSVQTITVNNSHCDKSIILDGEVDEHIECDLVEVLVDSYTRNQFFGGTSEYEFGVEPVLDNHKDEYPDITLHYGGQQDPEAPGPSAPRQSRSSGRSYPITVEDTLIYRIEGGYVNVYKLEYVCAPAKVDPKIETVRVWVAPHPGIINLTDSIMLLKDTSASRLHSLKADGVAYSIQLCDSVKAQSDSMHLHAYYYTLLNQGSIEANDSTIHKWDSAFQVKKGDVIFFRLRSGENSRFDKTRWHHIIRYVGETNIYDSEKDFICTGDNYFQAHNNGTFKLSLSGSNDGAIPVALKVQLADSVSSSYLLNTTLSHGTIAVLPIQNSVSSGQRIVISLERQSGYAEPRWSDIHLFPTLKYFSGFVVDTIGTIVQDTATYYPNVHITHTSLYQESSPYRKLFGALHKGWGAFAYQNIDGNIIILDSLVNTQQLAAAQVQQQGNSFATYLPDTTGFANSGEASMLNQVDDDFDDSGVFNPISENNYWVPMQADSRTEQWIAYGDLGCIGKLVHSNAREIILPDTIQDIVEYDSSIPFSVGEVRKNNFVRKKSRSVQNSISWGVMISPISRSVSFGSYETVVDYMDMNGDGYPDFVGKGGIQYSTPWGGIGQLLPVDHFSPVQSSNIAGGVSFSAMPAMLKKLASNNIRDGKFCLNASFGGSGGYGSSTTKISYMDVNADGLPDKIDVDSNLVRYNLGYGFSSPYPFYGDINKGNNASGSLNASLPPFSIGQVSISGGIGGSFSKNETERMLTDINGDGLPDQVFIDGSRMKVFYNMGQGYNGTLYDTLKTFHQGLTHISRDSTANFSTTLGATGGFTIMGIVKLDFGIQISPYSVSSSVGKAMLTDMNGDGLVDYVWKNGNQISVRYNTAGQANLLTGVTNPTGQEIRLYYNLSNPSASHRNRQWELTKIEDVNPNHPMNEAILSHINVEYESAYYDNFEKTDYGYAHVRTIINDEKVKDEYYHNQSLLQNGELYEDLISDADGRWYIRHRHGSSYLDLVTNDTVSNGSDVCEDANARVQQEGYWTEYYDSTPVGFPRPHTTPVITTYYNMEYDQHHNLIRYIDQGDVSTSDDDWKQEITYLLNTANNMVSLPKTEKVRNGSGRLLRSSFINYDQLGNPAHIHFEDTLLNLDAVTHLAYDNFGNISVITMPEDANGEYNWMNFIYDTIVHSYVVINDNAHAVCTRTDYDYRWGLPVLTIDPAGDTIKYVYDYKGRLEKVIAPIELRHGKDYTIRYTYNLINHNYVQSPDYDYTHVYKDMYDSLFVQQEVSLYDRRGKLLQKKHYAEVGGAEKWVVDGAEEWDAFGRVSEHEYPFWAEAEPFEYEPINNHSAIVRSLYDALDRPLQHINADGSTKSFVYDFLSDIYGVKRLMTQITDENGLRTRALKSPQDRLIQQETHDGGITCFEYSPIGELLQTTDADSYHTSYTYDMLGRMTSRVHPDGGTTTMEYDLAGNMISKQTANLALGNEKIQYVYKWGRLDTIYYPRHPENNVYYLYDSAGRISERKDGTGTEEFAYDQLGNVAQSTRRIVIPTESKAYQFRMQYQYDSFRRMRSIVYPDGELVNYGYTTGGLLKNIIGWKDNTQRIYQNNRLYDEQGRKTYQLDGNGVWTQYKYDSKRQWMDTMHTVLPNYDVLQNLLYAYDFVGNISSITQSAPALSIGGPYRNEYMYDMQYRLSQVNGYNSFPYSFSADYSLAGRMGGKSTSTTHGETELAFGYDMQRSTHQPRTVYDNKTGESVDLYWDANGNLSQIIGCSQNSARLHEWDEENRLRCFLGETYVGYYGYDGNGERVYKLTGTNTTNQLNSGSPYAEVIFDDAVLYPNPYMVVTPKGYTKHYYAGTERLATVIGGGGFSDMINPIESLSSQEVNDIVEPFYSHYEHHTYDPFYYEDALSTAVEIVNIEGTKAEYLQYQCLPIDLEYVEALALDYILIDAIYDNEQINDIEDEIYYYHGDHLGSANWITDANGYPIQYIHYAPYGELIENQKVGTYDERYKFTGKERDAESGYDYYGARFYSSVLGHFMSPDPHLDAHPEISSYAYCSWNPMNRIDPDGMDDEQREAAINMANQYVKMNPGKSYGWGEKGVPGQKVDCSGLVSNCAIAGGEKDPNKGQYNGVRNIANNTQKIEDMNDIIAGNFVTFNTGGRNGDFSHIGIITDVIRDDDGNVADFQFVHSGSSTGPIRAYASSRFSRNSSLCWKDIATGFYKWDTKPDTYGSILPETTIWGNKPSWLKSAPTLNVCPITINIYPCIRK